MDKNDEFYNVIDKEYIDDLFTGFQNSQEFENIISETVNTLESFKEGHEVIVSALTDKAVDIKELKVPQSFVLVVGNEANGVSSEVMKQASIITKIQIANIDSLNVAVATGILMDHLR